MTKDESSIVMLPRLMQQLELMNSETMIEYEKKLNETAEKALNALQGIIDDGSLALDPESLVEAVKNLTHARHIISEDKRKLLETTIRGTVMLKAINDESKKKDDSNEKSLLDKYFTQSLPEGTTIEDTAKNSVFNMDDEVIEDEVDNDTESSSDD